MHRRWVGRAGFTIVELLIVVVIIAVLATITIIAYNGVQSRARSSKIQTDISNVKKIVEAYNAEHGSYPFTAADLNPNWGDATARTDSGCAIGTQSTDWVPSVTAKLPQSSNNTQGAGGYSGCYIYASDGVNYILSAWNMIERPQNTSMYRRLGFREMDGPWRNVFYVCNHTYIGGDTGGGYAAQEDYYKHSVTVSNIRTCNETPPPGA